MIFRLKLITLLLATVAFAKPILIDENTNALEILPSSYIYCQTFNMDSKDIF